MTWKDKKDIWTSGQKRRHFKEPETINRHPPKGSYPCHQGKPCVCDEFKGVSMSMDVHTLSENDLEVVRGLANEILILNGQKESNKCLHRES